ncbi:MAG: hypothetical protein KDJ18_06940 [Hyphomicrobiaceae bacterium]|nr:hypothetical protein [Hyphomicrobiaceae bacterium]
METIHTAASPHLPAFITAPGETDVLLGLAGLILILAVLGAGVFFLWLHSLPERMVHNRLQYDLVAALALLSLFTHNHAFWFAALLLALISIPDLKIFDFQSPLRSIAKSLNVLANSTSDAAAAKSTPAAGPAASPAPKAQPAAPAAKEG